MGLGGISIWQLLIVLLIIVLIFGTKKLKGLGEDLGGAVRGFKKGLGEADEEPSDPAALNQQKTEQQKTAQSEDAAGAEKRAETDRTGSSH